MATKTVKEENTKGIVSLVLGIISILLFWAPIIGLVCGIIGIVLAVKQRKISKNSVTTGGFVTSIIGSILSLIYNILWLILAIFIGTAISTGSIYA